MAIELRLLHCALVLAEHKNFARAAKAVNVSQPTLSRNIQEIERRIETQLFERGAGGVIPTDAGEISWKDGEKLCAPHAYLKGEGRWMGALKKGKRKFR